MLNNTNATCFLNTYCNINDVSSAATNFWKLFLLKTKYWKKKNNSRVIILDRCILNWFNVLYEKWTNVIYNYTLNNNDVVPPAIFRWINELTHGQNWCIQDCFKVDFEITFDTNIQWLQWSTLHRILTKIIT